MERDEALLALRKHAAATSDVMHDQDQDKDQDQDWAPRNGDLSYSEANRLREAFKKMDVNGNGSVSHVEFVEVLSTDKELCKLLSRGIST